MAAERKQASKQVTLVDLFCGAGGLSLGFTREGFSTIQAIDSGRSAVESYRANFDHEVIESQVSDDTELPSADVIVGGPPCQGFSSAGPRRKGDDRNTLVGVFSRLIAGHKPKAFLFENVEGFLTNDDGKFVVDLLDPLIEAGYWVHVIKINAANFGVPQHRKRVIVIGGLGWSPTLPKPTHSAWGAPGATAFAGLPLTPPLQQALRGLPPASCSKEDGAGMDHTYTPLSDTDLERAKLLGPGQRMRDLPEELWHDSYRRRAFRRVQDGTPTDRRGGAPAGLRRLRWDEPSKAITGGAQNEFLHPEEHRPLTLRECARLQTFPDTFRFIGKRAEKMQLIGNAVPPSLAAAIARQLLVDLNGNRSVEHGRGKLLTFRPTVAVGMSPVLDRVCRAITKRYGESTWGLFSNASL